MSECYDKGYIEPATQVDHVIPHKGDYSLMWDEDGNWQALCARCGAIKSARGL